MGQRKKLYRFQPGTCAKGFYAWGSLLHSFAVRFCASFVSDISRMLHKTCEYGPQLSFLAMASVMFIDLLNNITAKK